MSIHTIKTGLITAILFSLMAVPFQLAAEEKEKMTRYKDWGYKCETPKGFDQKICFIFQRISNKENNKKIADITIAYSPKADKPIMVVVLPLGVLLPAGIQLKIDQGDEAARAQFVQCIQDGCQARLELDSKLIKKMKSGNKLRVAFFTPLKKQLAFPVSLNGFTAAINSLKKK